MRYPFLKRASCAALLAIMVLVPSASVAQTPAGWTPTPCWGAPSTITSEWLQNGYPPNEGMWFRNAYSSAYGGSANTPYLYPETLDFYFAHGAACGHLGLPFVAGQAGGYGVPGSYWWVYLVRPGDCALYYIVDPLRRCQRLVGRRPTPLLLMAVTVDSVIMALGGCSIDCEADPELAKLLRLDLPPADRPLFHILFYTGEEHDATRVLTQQTVTATRITLGGPSPEWHLGTERGPLIEKREYVAGTNKLSNPSFEPPLGTLRWRFAEGSGWEVSGRS